MKTAKLTKKILRASSTITILVLLGLFFVQQNILAQQKSYLASYTKELNESSSENENLETGFFEKNHLDNIKEVAHKMNFERTDKIFYIKAFENAVVAKNEKLAN